MHCCLSNKAQHHITGVSEMNGTNILNTLLPQIITAGATLIGVIVTTAFSIIQNRVSHKRELAKLEHDYRLKALSLDEQIKKDAYIETFRKMSKTNDAITSLSVKAHTIEREMMRDKSTSYPAGFDEEFDEVEEMRSDLYNQLAVVELFLSPICLHHFVLFLNIVNRISNKDYDRFTPLALFLSDTFSEFYWALGSIRNNFFEQCKAELYISATDKHEVYSICTPESYASGDYIKRKNGDIVLLAGSRTKRGLEEGYYEEDGYYVMSRNEYFKTAKEAAAYLVGNDMKYETKRLTF